MRNLLYAISILALAFTACKNDNSSGSTTGMYITDTAQVNGIPAWILQGNIYEVNVRQYTPEGSFEAFMDHLDRLKSMGVQTLWFMPVQPISKADRKGELGSYYAIADYTAVNPEFGTIENWKHLVKTAHDKGFKVLLDWVANHSGADHYWLTTNPDFYINDSATGLPRYAFDWSDTRELNYDNLILQDSMINEMKFWLETGIDGFRCDVAAEVPGQFWKKAIGELRKINPGIFMLAEANDPWLYDVGFNATYPWEEFNAMKKIASGESNALLLDSIEARLSLNYPANAIRMYFTSNHDENSWNKADYGTMPGTVHAPFAVLTQTWARALPLIYSGQEQPTPDSISFFYKDTMHFDKLERAPFYKSLLELRKNNAALSAIAPYQRFSAANESQVMAYSRSSGQNKVVVVLNLSSKEARIELPAEQFIQAPQDFISTLSSAPATSNFTLGPWGYAVFARR